MLSASLEHVILRYFEDLGTPFSLQCAILWRSGERGALARLSCRPEDYDTPERYFRSVSALAFIKKLKNLLSNERERREAAIEKWIEGEVSCYRANLRLYPYLPTVRGLDRDDRINQHFAGVRAIVEELIGRSPPDLLEGRFGPGATFANRGRRTTVPHKIDSNPTLTSNCVWLLPQFLETAWGRHTALEKELAFVPGCRFTTVPKTSIIDRSIAVEPSINVFYQLAAGRIIRNRLRANGWDLDYAQDVHRAKAREASVTREFATLDLSNASDTVSRNLVKLLLPHRWVGLLEILRSPKITDPSATGRWRVLEKFSSMGNGFTFELETVIFAAMSIYLTRLEGREGILGKDVFVFGDDIIVRNDVVRALTALLEFCGFSINREKSFVGESPFRESCGADFWSGIDVRPSYLKEEPSDVQASFGVLNRITAVYDKLSDMGASCDRRAWRFALSQVPQVFRRCMGPRGLGDAVIWAQDEREWRTRRKNSIRYIYGLRTLSLGVIPYSKFHPEAVLACATYGAGNVGTPEKGHVPVVEGVRPRDGPRSHVRGWLPWS